MENQLPDREKQENAGRSEGDSGKNSETTDDRSQTAKALDIVSRITAICLMMVLPAIGGYYVDQWLGTVVVFVLLGTAFGFFAGGWQLYKLIQQMNADS